MLEVTRLLPQILGAREGGWEDDWVKSWFILMGFLFSSFGKVGDQALPMLIDFESII